jgi:hypothetical protein
MLLMSDPLPVPRYLASPHGPALAVRVVVARTTRGRDAVQPKIPVRIYMCLENPTANHFPVKNSVRRGNARDMPHADGCLDFRQRSHSAGASGGKNMKIVLQ